MSALLKNRFSATIKSNIVIYGGPGVARESLLQAKQTLKMCFRGVYDVIVVDGVEFSRDNWELSTAAVVVPGGRDQPMLGAIGPAGFARIRAFVEQGGRYIGFCAGAYLASERIAFEVDRPNYKVVGERPLKFFRGEARGAAFPGFVYNSGAGSRIAMIRNEGRNVIKSYWNGGPVFIVDPEHACNTIVVAEYADSGARFGPPYPAVVISTVDKGKALLSGAHWEYLDPRISGKASPLSQFASLEAQRDFQRASLRELIRLLHHIELPANPIDSSAYSSLLDSDSSPAYVVSVSVSPGQSLPVEFVQSLSAIAGHQYTLRSASNNFAAKYWSERAKFNWLPNHLGHTLLHSERLDSTQRFLNKLCTMDTPLKSGTVVVADEQEAGQGRGSNGWISQLGCLQFSLLLTFSLSQLPKYFVCLQYLLALVLVESAKHVDPQVQVFLKWPNDIYAVSPETRSLVKIGGILVQSHAVNSTMAFVAGCGINVANKLPTTSLHAVSEKLAAVEPAAFLALFLYKFDEALRLFSLVGSFVPFLDRYYAHWLHTDQEVTLEREGNKRVVIKGIDENGFLVALSADEYTEQYHLQPDSNSFDMFKGLLKIKR